MYRYTVAERAELFVALMIKQYFKLFDHYNMCQNIQLCI